MALSLHLYFIYVLVIVCKAEKNLLLLLCAAFDLAYEGICLSLQMWLLGLVVCLAWCVRFTVGLDDV